MLPRPTTRFAVFGTGALLLTALAAPFGATASATAVPASTSSSTAYSAFSSGDIVYANAANLAPTDVAKASTGQSSAGVGEHGGTLTIADQLKQPLLSKSTTGKTAYGHGSGVNVGVLGSTMSQPQVASTLVEATSPAPSAATGGNAVPAAPLLTATVLPGAAAANTLADGSCVTGKDLSNGSAHVADATILDAGAAATVGTLGGTSDTLSHTKLVHVSGDKYGVVGETTLTLAPLTILKGTPLAVTIELLKNIQLTAQATGVKGSSFIHYGAVGAVDTTPVLKLTIGGQTETLTSQQVFGGKGIVLALGAADIVIGGPAHSLTGNVGSAVGLASNGTSATASADFVKVTVPGTLPVPTTNPFDGVLAPLNSIVNPVLSSASSALGPIQSALTSAGLNVADLRQGHLEATAAVPVGGITCESDNPLDESTKDVSALHVVRGGTFQYDIRVPNRGTSDITNVKVVDTYANGLQFVSSVPTPASTGTNTLTYDLGTIAPNAFKTIVMTFKVPDDAVTGTKYHNSAVITGTYNGEPVTKTVSVDGPTVGPTPVGACNLSGSTKFASNLRVKTGEEFGYFVNVLNSGGEPCLSTKVTDTLIDGVSFVSCSDSCTQSGQDLTWELGTLAPGQSRVLYVLVKVTATSGSLPNTAVVTSPSGPGGAPYTPGPIVGTTTVVSPGHPADGPDGALPRTGLDTGMGALALLLLGGGGLALRRRRT